tara:strand:+ start:715 stop:1140 length:426 start_codon:yes stop_codon:yes gene_type:complete
MEIVFTDNKNIRHFTSEETESKITLIPTLLEAVPKLEISIENEEAERATGIFDEDETKSILFHLAEHFNTERNRGMNRDAKSLTIKADDIRFNLQHTNYGDPFREGVYFQFVNGETWIRCFVDSRDARELSTFLTKLLTPE